MVQAVSEHVILEDHLVHVPLYFQLEGVFLSHAPPAAVLPVEVFGIRHAEGGGKLLRVSGEDSQMHMRGHFRIHQNLRIHGKSPERHQVHEHSMVFPVPEHHLLMRGEADMIRLFHAGKVRTSCRNSNNRKKHFSVLHRFFAVFYDCANFFVDLLSQ